MLNFITEFLELYHAYLFFQFFLTLPIYFYEESKYPISKHLT